MPTKRLPAKVDRAVREKVTNGYAGLRKDSVVEKGWKDTGGTQQNDVRRDLWEVRNISRRKMIEIRERPALRNKVV